MDKLQLNIPLIEIKDERIFRSLFDLFYPRAYVFACHILQDTGAGADIAQEAFLYIWQKTSTFPNVQAFKVYLYQVLKNKCLNYMRDLHKSLDIEQWHEKIADNTALEHLIIEQELRARILQEINELSEIRRKIMLLRLEGKSFEEISRELNLNINTVKAHKKESYKFLRIKLSDYDKMAFVFGFIIPLCFG